jgi:hypothetical protein
LVATLWLLVCLALVMQGAHACGSGDTTDPGAPVISSVQLPCPVCAIVHSLLVVLIFFLIPLVLTHIRISLPFLPAKPCWRGPELYVRPPPAF